MKNRLVITIPLLAIGALLTQLNFDVLWRYFSWSNQTLAMISLWVSTAYLLKKKDNKFLSLFTALPATFMSALNIHSNGKRRFPGSTVNRLSNWRMLRSLLFRVLSYST